MKMQGTRIEDQRSSLPGGGQGDRDREQVSMNGLVNGMAAPTMPDEDFFSLICRLQGGRLEEQRAHLPGGAWPGPQLEPGHQLNGHSQPQQETQGDSRL